MRLRGQLVEAPQPRDDRSEMEEETPRDHAPAMITEAAPADDQHLSLESAHGAATTQPDVATPPSAAPRATGPISRLVDSPEDQESLDLVVG